MKGFSQRERRIIRAAYRDAARICSEREWEAEHGHNKENGRQMAAHLKELMPGRAKQILLGANLPMKARRASK